MLIVYKGLNHRRELYYEQVNFLVVCAPFVRGMEIDFVEELPVRLAHRVKDLDHLPDKLHEMPSINKVKNWYAQSFEVVFQCIDMKILTV